MQRVVKFAGVQLWKVLSALGLILTILTAAPFRSAVNNVAAMKFSQMTPVDWVVFAIFAISVSGFGVYVLRIWRAEGFVAPDEARLRGALEEHNVKWVASLKGRSVVREGARCPECDVNYTVHERALSEIYGNDEVAGNGGTVGARDGKRAGDLLKRTEDALVCPKCDRVVPAFLDGPGEWERVKQLFERHFRLAEHDYDDPDGAWNQYRETTDDEALLPACGDGGSVR